MTDPYIETRSFVQRLVGIHGGPAPAAGSPAWCALGDADPAKLLAVLHAGSAHVLNQCHEAIDDRRLAIREASVAISQAKDWAAVAKRIRDRDEFRRAHPWAVREVTR
ncbi:DUF2742 domain-containing protein [Gordonia sp. ABSL49_1]|uniref:DUF2742 domain-containing protein n=1 Tax=Gordonia sp. ABSL49_1 TaxID=2920941 RepID=UPI001F0E5BFC|nr:DUF2742 domain-containing protein [Gordonia sp. ABSL49_1]MCH5645360.1 DUF2742 domain-containing protein [Gordonia sp. ABSL49_1]